MATLAAVRKIFGNLPGTTEGLSYGAPAFYVAGKYVGRLLEDGVTISVYMGHDEREAWCALDPHAFSVPASFARYPYIAVNLEAVQQEDLRTVLTNAWRSRAPANIVKQT